MVVNNGILPGEYRLQYIRGLPFLHNGNFSKDKVEAAFDYLPRDEDIIITSYPKTGTTWLQYIILQIISKGKSFPSFNDALLKESPLLEIVGTAPVEALHPPRSFHHHLPFNMVKKNKKAKYVYIYRNPEDTLVSYYHFTQNVSFGSSIDFNQFVEDFISADVPFGSYFEHVKSYLSHKYDNNLLILTYEDLHKDTQGEILKIARFLGDDYLNAISNDASLLNTIIKNTSFENMKKKLCYILPFTVSNNSWKYGPKKVEFFRKGITGEGKKYLTINQQNRLRCAAERVLYGTDAISEWYSK